MSSKLTIVLFFLTSLLTSGRASTPRVDTLFAIAGDIGLPPVHSETWKGSDPCQNWYGISCSENRITMITLTNTNLTGFISHRFAELSTLNAIDLSHNRLTGTIPLELLFKLENLTILDVSYNDLHGKIPGFRKEVVFAAGNHQMETDFVIWRQTSVWIGIGIGLLVALVIGVLYYYLVFLRSSDSETEPEPQPPNELQFYIV